MTLNVICNTFILIFEKNKTMKKERYAIDLDAYIHTESDEQAIDLAEKIKKLINDTYPDALADILSISKAPFGTIGTTEIIYPK